MRATKHECELPHKTQLMSLQSVKFKDGMVITADDLDTAVRYPVDVFRSLVRAYFGCGIVCGLEIHDPGARDYKEVKDCPRLPAPNFTVCIEPGVALGCDGYPIELCAPIKLDLTRNECCPPLTEDAKVTIAIRRCTSDDAPRQDCGCQAGNCGCGQKQGQNGHASSCQCTRVRDHVEVKVFDKPPPGLCPQLVTEKTDPKKIVSGGAVAERETKKVSICDCLRACSGCDACGESWVLLGEVTIPKKAVGSETQAGISLVSPSRRQYVKPTQCICKETERLKEVDDERLKAYAEQQAKLEDRLTKIDTELKDIRGKLPK